MSKEDGKTAPTNASRDNAGIKRRSLWLRSTSFAAASALAAAAFPRAATAAAQDEVLPRAELSLPGAYWAHRKGFAARRSEGHRGSSGAFNVLLMLTDDVGFGAQSCRFGAVDDGKQTLVESE